MGLETMSQEVRRQAAELRLQTDVVDNYRRQQSLRSSCLPEVIEALTYQHWHHVDKEPWELFADMHGVDVLSSMVLNPADRFVGFTFHKRFPLKVDRLQMLTGPVQLEFDLSQGIRQPLASLGEQTTNW